ncbi:hypothetical protein ACN23B_01060 [Anabaena sp. FACHB-709]|uniref:DNA-binding protein n=2 Tax=Nostocaceae TaxID=1162 RepID=A0A1Z4KQA7_ANAVA|nr:MULTISPECIES: hypothetical protein [Nostocaceae]BAY71182.1 hypothetical protein NIES23_39980 [Trichormus variabilis NIES-23]HBW32739.1 hypothetical protein [Nostoc sp. UBA8866]MBD2171978.1 hypothetical protein [Anabaena cylindrica FACHB-318]MBD2263556.1 hypothetical protein [Anabaena sp. FACHB-709]MBD2273100.1 hypothetical protein [Nostoc sp. PCC 7120 = FACHB-418]
MRQTKKIHSLGLMFPLLIGVFSCASVNVSEWKDGNISFGRNITPIRNIKSTQDQQAKVYIQGQVEKQVPLLQRWVYKINDSTGTIWVLTKQNNLKPGESVVFKGKVQYKSIPIAGEEFGELYLVEE